MFVALADGSQIRGDFVLSAVQRFDLTPIPATLELVLRVDATLGGRIAEGATLLAGSGPDRYTVVKMQRAPSELLQGTGGPAEALEVTAVLEGLEPLARPLARAVVKASKSLGEVYRACGARVRVRQDVPVLRFACFVGDFPTVHIARALQQEACVPVWRDGALSFVRYADLFTGRPAEALARDTTRVIASGFLEQHEIPAAMSTDAAGAVVLGRRDTPRGMVFLPRTPPRVLDNMTRCLVVRRRVVGSFAGHLRAGDGLEVAGGRHVIVTAAHAWEAGADGRGVNQTTTLWLAQLQR